jgi:biopolymer transport protein ExbD
MLLNSRADDMAPSLDLTPIIDMVFNLLIFFLIASSFQQVEREMNIALPQASASGPLSTALREIVVNVGSDGRIVVNARETSLTDLAAMIQGAVKANPTQKVSVRGDRNAAYGGVAGVLDVCKQSGVAEPFLSTIPAQ